MPTFVVPDSLHRLGRSGTTDTDFGTILALSGAAGPSVLLLRSVGDSIDERVNATLHALSVVEGGPGRSRDGQSRSRAAAR